MADVSLTLRLADSGINDLQDTDAKCRRLSRSRLGLRDGISSLADLDNGT